MFFTHPMYPPTRSKISKYKMVLRRADSGNCWAVDIDSEKICERYRHSPFSTQLEAAEHVNDHIKKKRGPKYVLPNLLGGVGPAEYVRVRILQSARCHSYLKSCG